eukprot:4924797-Pyramimonas_sp.AAC.1
MAVISFVFVEVSRDRGGILAPAASDCPAKGVVHGAAQGGSKSGSLRVQQWRLIWRCPPSAHRCGGQRNRM